MILSDFFKGVDAMNVAFIPGMPGWSEGLLVLLVILLLFGAKRLPELARSLGKSLSEFKKGREEGARSPTESDASEEKKLAPSEEIKTNEEEKS